MNVRMAMSAVLVGVLVLAACSDGSDPEQVVLPSPTASAQAASPEPSPSPTASAGAADDPGDEIDVTVVPDEITPEYVEAVFAEIEEGRIRSTVAVLESSPNSLSAIPTGTRADLEHWLTGRQLEAAVASLEDLASNSERRSRHLPPDQVTGTRAEVLRVVAGNESCMVVVARLDDSGLLRDGAPRDVLTILSFAPHTPTEANPTPWRIAFQLRNTDEDGEPNPDSFALEADLQTIAEAADVTCEEVP